MKTINLNESGYLKLKKRIDEETDPFYDIRTTFEDFKAAFDQCAVETSDYEEEGRTLHPFLEAISKNINFDAIEDILNKKYYQQNKFYDSL